jgi:tRNA pseudouridine32 synthase/23S rRNA pseudouridine746 synthase
MIKISFEHSDFILIDKPAGLSFHSEHHSDSDRGVMAQLEEQLGLKLFSLHRLDKGTSGLLTFAKNKRACQKLSQMWQQKLVKKLYLAISDQRPKKKQGCIQGDMLKSRRGSYKLTRGFDNPAITQFVSTSIMPGKRLYLCHPITGKTHQIRVALKSIGASILGDTRYGGSPADRLYLHCYGLEFEYNSEKIQVRCLPTHGSDFLRVEFKNSMDYFGNPFQIIWPAVRGG